MSHRGEQHVGKAQGKNGLSRSYLHARHLQKILLNIGLVFKSYAQNLGQLNALRNQEAELIQKKADLENDISRWSDDAYVTAQARKRLGFVFPGERSVLVKNAPQDAQHNSTEEKSRTEDKKLPWYNEILYAMESTDRAENPNGATSQAQ